MNFKRDSDSQEADAVRFRNLFFNRLNHDPESSKQIGNGLHKLLTNNFEKPQKNGVALAPKVSKLQKNGEVLAFGDLKVEGQAD